MRAARTTLLGGTLLALGLAGAAAAAPAPAKLTFADPAGDNTSPGAASDIVGVTWTTAGTRSGKTYTPKQLVVSLKLAAPPTADGTTRYLVGGTLSGCGYMSMSFSPGASLIQSSGYAECTGSDGTLFDAMPEVKGSSVVWTLSMKALPGDVRPGSTFSALHAYTDLVDPATGLGGVGSATEGPDELGLYDNARTTATFTVR